MKVWWEHVDGEDGAVRVAFRGGRHAPAVKRRDPRHDFALLARVFDAYLPEIVGRAATPAEPSILVLAMPHF